MYQLIRITPLAQIGPNHERNINLAISVAEKSRFDDSKRLGALLEGKGRFLCW